jgi:hypothetical protein
VRPGAALGLALMLGVLGCSAPPAEPGPRETVARIAPELALGEVHVYALDWQTHAVHERSGMAIAGGLSLRGELAIAALEHSPEGTRVAAWWLRVDEAALSVQGEAVELDRGQLLAAAPVEFVVDASGDIGEVYFAADCPAIVRELMLGVIARYDLRAATPSGQRRALRGGHGLVEVGYRRQGDGVVRRELARVLRFDTQPELGAQLELETLTAEASIELDAERVPVAIVQRDGLDQPQLGLVADDRFSLIRARVTGDPLPARARELIAYDPNAGPDPEAVALAMDQQLAAGTTLADLARALDTIDGGVLPRPGFVSRAAALLRAEPDQIQGLVELAARADGNGRQLGFDLLAAAGSPAAQLGMWMLLDDPAADTWPERALLVQRFAFVLEPTVDTGVGLITQLERAQRDGDHVMIQALLHPIGTVAGRLGDPLVAERMHRLLTRSAASEDPAIRAAAIAGLGNARRASDVERLTAALRDPEPDVRVEAAAALRTQVVPAATEALLDALADPQIDVAVRALRVLHQRHFEGEADPRLVERATLGQYTPGLARDLVSALAGNREQAPVRAALAAIAERLDESEPELARALALLLREGAPTQ